MINLIEIHKKEIDEACKTHDVNQLFVFGSILTERFNEKSDIDFIASFINVPLLDFADNYLSFCEQLQRILKRDVQVVVDSSIRNPFFRKQVDLTKQLLFAA